MTNVFQIPLPKTKVVLKLVSCSEGPRFHSKIAKVFLNLWAAIEDSDRLVITAYWKTKPGRSIPKILFADSWRGPKNSLACCEDQGTVIQGNLPWFRLLPLEVMEAVFAHEIAHVFQFAIGKNRFNLSTDDFRGKQDADSGSQIFIEMLGPVGRVELHADEIMQRWGYDHLLPHTWMLQHTEHKANERVLRKVPLPFNNARKKASQARPLFYCCDTR